MAINNNTILDSGNAVFTAPGSNQEHAVTCVIFCNIGADATLTVHVIPSGSSVSNTNTIIKTLTIPAGETFTFDTEKLVLSSGDAIHAIASINDALVCTVSSMRVS